MAKDLRAGCFRVFFAFQGRDVAVTSTLWRLTRTMNVALGGAALCLDQVEALVEEMDINRLCGQTQEMEFAENHIPEGESAEFYRGMASGLLLAACVAEGDDELVGMLRALAARSGQLMLS